jgi:hypothetical protein
VIERIEEEKLKKASSVSFAFDGWSCAAGRTVGIAYYFIDDDWKLQHCFLDLVGVRETSNAATISSVVAAQLHICNLAVEKCFEDVKKLENLIKKLVNLFAWLRTANV